METKASGLYWKFIDDCSKLDHHRAVEDAGSEQERDAFLSKIKGLATEAPPNTTDLSTFPFSGSDSMVIYRPAWELDKAKATAEDNQVQAVDDKTKRHINILVKGWKDEDEQKSLVRDREDAMRVANLAEALLQLKFRDGPVADLLPYLSVTPLSGKRTAGREFTFQYFGKWHRLTFPVGEKRGRRAKAVPKARKSRAKAQTPEDIFYTPSRTSSSALTEMEEFSKESSTLSTPIKFR